MAKLFENLGFSQHFQRTIFDYRGYVESLQDRLRDTTSRSQPQLPVPKAARRLRVWPWPWGIGQELANEKAFLIFSSWIWKKHFYHILSVFRILGSRLSSCLESCPKTTWLAFHVQKHKHMVAWWLVVPCWFLEATTILDVCLGCMRPTSIFPARSPP